MLQDFKAYRTLFLSYLTTREFREEPLRLHEPINYIMAIGGKRVRPVSLLIAANIYSNDLQPALPVAYAFELFHNFTLAHDDVMDDAELRRGQAAMHVQYGLSSAILSGDAMLIYSYQAILETRIDTGLKNKILMLFSDTAVAICKGQQMDMDFETMEKVNLPDYLLMIKYKTAVLLAACLKAGAWIGGASDEDADHLYAYGLNIGLAFQIQDDLLDLYADKADFGKKVGGDILQQKKTFLYLKALELAADDQKAELIRLYRGDSIDDQEKIQAVRSVFDELGIRGHAEQLMKELTENAAEHLQSLAVDPEQLVRLHELNHLLLQRKH
jgi:geranylgeranyl diphosphate synthase type II